MGRSHGAASLPPDAHGTVTSADGTSIAYRRSGGGPGLVLMHGGMMAGQNFTNLAAALSDAFTVYVPDRRGRGRSGPMGAYSLGKEVDDLAALLEATGARNVFGLSSGAVICLRAALDLPSIDRLALYEPPLSVGNSYSQDWVRRYDDEVARGKMGAAMVTVIKGTRDRLGLLPRFILVPLMTLALNADAKATDEARVPLRDLIPTMHYDAQAVTEAAGLLDACTHLAIRVLLIGGSKSPAYLKTALAALADRLPNASRVELAGADHMAADNGGKPDLVAQRLREFFHG
jgi:pimeloyl-ACP methyl ester carboxylesterase